MKLLAIDTSSIYLSLALSDGENGWVFHEPVGQQHSERTLPEIAKLLAQSQLSLAELDAIVFGQGPGSFTGLRIGCGVAQGLAFSANVPVIAIPSLDNIASQAGTGQVLVCMDARMQQVYSAAYQIDSTWQRLSPIQVQDPEALVWPEHITIAAGNGFAQYPALLAQQPATLTVLDQLQPHAAHHITLARSGRYPMQAARQAELLYIRNKVALTSQEQQARQK